MSLLHKFCDYSIIRQCDCVARCFLDIMHQKRLKTDGGGYWENNIGQNITVGEDAPLWLSDIGWIDGTMFNMLSKKALESGHCDELVDGIITFEMRSRDTGYRNREYFLAC